MSISPAGINADIASLIPEAKTDIGEAVSTSFQAYDAGTSYESKKWALTFQAGEIAMYSPGMSQGPNITRNPQARSKKASYDSGDDPTFKRVYMDILTIMAEYYSKSVIQWKTLTASTPGVAPTKTWPKDVVTKCFQRCLLHKDFELAKRYVKLGADISKYIGEQSMNDPIYYVDRDHIPEYAKNANALHWACERPCLESFQFLKQHGFWNIAAKDGGDRTPLHYLMTGLQYRGYPEVRIPIMKIILDDPLADQIVNAQSKKGNTPLNAMVVNPNYDEEQIHDITAALLEYSPVKVDLTTPSADGLTPSEYFAEVGMFDTASLVDSYKGPTRAPAKPSANAKPAAPLKQADIDAASEDLDKLLANLGAEVPEIPPAAAPARPTPRVGSKVPPSTTPAATPVAKPAAPVAKPAFTPVAKPTPNPVVAKPAFTPVTASPSKLAPAPKPSGDTVPRAEHEKLKKKVETMQAMLEIIVGQIQFNPALNKLVYEMQKMDKE